jgi:zinc transport system substrate-binding protein
MKSAIIRTLGSVLLSAAVLSSTQAFAQGATTSAETTHSHQLAHEKDDIYNGYFKDEQIKARALADWQGEWQSVYPYLEKGTLAKVMEHKAEGGGMTAAEYTEYYRIGYKTDVDKITIKGDSLTFFRGDKAVEGKYADDGHETLTYKKGNRGVRYIFRKVGGDDTAPQFIQFSDHRIAPATADHYHLYWGDDRARLLEEVTNWPTYYPATLNGEQIVEEMLAH